MVNAEHRARNVSRETIVPLMFRINHIPLCVMGTETEVLVAGDCILDKDEQDPALAQDYRHMFDLD
jgi:hypothetical protein